MDLYVYKLDRGVEAIRAAFHLDQEVKVEGSRPVVLKKKKMKIQMITFGKQLRRE